MPPPLAGPANVTAPPDVPDTPDTGGGGPPGAVPSGGPGADQAQGMLPPTQSRAPLGGNIAPAGNQALGDQLMSNIVGAMHYARMFYPPGSEKEKLISHHFKGLSKLFMPDSGTMKGGAMPPPNQVARGGPPPAAGPPGAGGGPPPGPPLGGMGGAAGAPPMPPRGPIPMAAGPR